MGGCGARVPCMEMRDFGGHDEFEKVTGSWERGPGSGEATEAEGG